MKRIIMFVLLFAALKVAGQTTGYLRFDTVRIMKQNGTCELYLINKTKDSLGLLTNVGGGLTQFRKSKMFNDSTIIIGLDTLVIRGAGGATPSWGQTTKIGNINSSTLIFDTTMVGNPVYKEWANYAPLVKTDTATNAFHQWQFSGSNNGSFNEVMLWGWNVGNGGGQHIAGKPAIGESWESNYQINPTYPAASDRLVEKHEIYVEPAGTQHRLSSYTINTNTGTISYYHTVGNFSLYNVATHTPYYSVLGTANNTQQTYINSVDQTEYFSVSTDFEQDVNTANFTIGTSSGKPLNYFNVSGFTGATLPSAEIHGQGYDGAEVSFYGATTGQLSKFLSDSSETRLANLTNVPINFVVDGTVSLAAYKTKVQTAVPLIVNNSNPASVPFAGVESLVSTASLEAGGWFRHSGTAASNKYGIEVSAIGANGTNEALYLNASNGDNNRAIRIQFPSAGASNHAIYSDATAQSYIAGKVGIGSGVTSPDSTLHINGSFHNNAGVRMEGLPSGPGTKAVRIDANGTLSIADTSAGGSDGNGIYSGSGSLPGNVTVTGSNNSITFDDIFAHRINSDYNVIAKANGTGAYTEAIIGAGNIYEIGFTPTVGVFSKGAGVFIDTNENVGMGAQPPTAMPLYATGASLFVQGLQSNHGNFYKVSNLTTDATASLAAYFYTIDASGGNVTVTLPAASTAFGNTMGITYKFQRIDNSGNTVTIQRAGSDTINGGTSFTITTQWTEVRQVQCTSTSTWAQWQ